MTCSFVFIARRRGASQPDRESSAACGRDPGIRDSFVAPAAEGALTSDESVKLPIVTVRLLSLAVMIFTLMTSVSAAASLITPAQRVERYVFRHEPTVTRYVNRYDALGGKAIVVDGVTQARDVTLGVETNRTGRTIQNRSIGMLVCDAATKAIRTLRLSAFSSVWVTDTAGQPLASNIGNGCRP